MIEKPKNPKFEDLTGVRFGAITVTEYLGKQGIKSYWGYTCDCGKTGKTASGNIKKKISCGCLHAISLADRRTSHGETTNASPSPEWNTLNRMISRCGNPSNHAFKYYGGRGISVCSRWKEGENGMTGVECFIQDMGRRPSNKHSIDRYPDNDGNYEPSNCRWATDKQQQTNRSGCHWVSWDGEKITIQEACDRSNLSSLAVHARLGRGWTLERALRTPSRGIRGGLKGNVEIIDIGTERRSL